MEPLSNPIAGALKLRALQATNANLAVLLKDGMVVSGEVVDVTDGTAHLSLGGRRVPAETQVELRPGERFLARVQHQGDSLVLKLLPEAPEPEQTLVAALRTVLAEDRPLGAILARVASELRDLYENRADPKTRARVEALVRRLESFVHTPDGSGPSLARALAQSGLFHEALLLGDEDALRQALTDLKSVLLGALESATEGPEREALEHALAGLEAEQLLDVARQQSGDPRHWSVAIPDGAQLASAHLLVQPEGGREQDESGAPAPAAHGVDLAVNFSHLGSVRAEFRLTGRDLAVRFLAAEPDVAMRIAADREILIAGLEAGGLAPRLAVVTAHELGRDAEPALGDVRFLRDHLVLDISG